MGMAWVMVDMVLMDTIKEPPAPKGVGQYFSQTEHYHELGNIITLCKQCLITFETF
jgi:hypothetical protein